MLRDILNQGNKKVRIQLCTELLRHFPSHQRIPRYRRVDALTKQARDRETIRV